MADQTATADTLNELTLFINDRIEGYKTAVKDSKDAANKSYYEELVRQSEEFARTINGFAQRAGGEKEDSTTVKGKIYRAFMDARTAVLGKDEASVLAYNVYGEEWAIKAYEEALASGNLSGDAQVAVERQLKASRETHRKLQQLKGAEQV